MKWEQDYTLEQELCGLGEECVAMRVISLQ